MDPQLSLAKARLEALIERACPNTQYYTEAGPSRDEWRIAISELESEARAEERERVAKAFDALAESLPAGILRDGFGRDAARVVRGLKPEAK